MIQKGEIIIDRAKKVYKNSHGNHLGDNMKKLICLLIAVMFLSGCALTGYYTDPQKAGYNQQIWNCLCEKCNRVFVISTSQYDSGAYISCPYCGQSQDPRLARNRGVYAEQQQRAANSQAYWQASQQQRAALQQKQNELLREMQEESRRRQEEIIHPPLGSQQNPIYIKEREY